MKKFKVAKIQVMLLRRYLHHLLWEI